MKKFVGLLLAAMLLLCSFSAVAEETSVAINDDLSLSFVVPDGYTFSENWYYDILYATFTPDAENGVTMTLSVGFSEEYADRSIGDLTDEELESVVELTREDFNDPTITMQETAHGTKLIVADENSEYDEYAEITTIYQGYFISVMLQPGEEGVQLTVEQLQVAIDVLSNMEFVHASK